MDSPSNNQDDVQFEAQKQQGIGHTMLVVVVTSIAAAMTGLVALYFVYAERWGDQITRRLSGEESLNLIFWEGTLDGWVTVAAPAVSICLAMTLIVVVQRKWFPGTEGTGIPQAIAALKIGNAKARGLMLSLWIAFGKVVLLTVALLFGITVGREGPSVHVGACFMHICNRVCRLPSYLVARGMILAGSAAGIAAAFNTPIAGVVFCFEEVGRTFDRESVPAIIRTVAIACVVGVVFLGDYLFYGDANITARLPLGIPSIMSKPDGTFMDWLMEMRQWIAVPVVGILGGFLGGWFGRGVVQVSRFTGPRLVRHPLRMGLILGLCLAVIGILSSGESYGGGYDQAKEMLTTAHETGESITPWHYPITKAAASFVSLVSAIPGGLFDPSLAVGASLGQVTHGLFDGYIAPGITLPALMMLFMAAYFAGVVQSPITVFTIMFEMTGAYEMILPLMFAAMLGAMVARRICNPSIYEALAMQFLDAKGITVTEKTTPA
ncbi:MAG: chloride channel protein [Phycisphaerales bacterium]|nr:chloride channel protein [Phycisphaerales bacterium]